MVNKMIDLGYTLGKLEETKLEGGERTLQLTLCQPGDEDSSPVAIRIWDLQGIKNLQEALYDVLVDFEVEAPVAQISEVPAARKL